MKETLEQYLSRGGQIQKLESPTDEDSSAIARARRKLEQNKRIRKEPGEGRLRKAERQILR